MGMPEQVTPEPGEVPNDLAFIIRDRPDHVCAALTAGMAYEDAMAPFDQANFDTPTMRVVLGDVEQSCSVEMLTVPRRALLVALQGEDGTKRWLLLRRGAAGGVGWEVATVLFEQPYEESGYDEDDEARFDREGAALLRFVSRAFQFGWFRPLSHFQLP